MFYNVIKKQMHFIAKIGKQKCRLNLLKPVCGLSDILSPAESSCLKKVEISAA